MSLKTPFRNQQRLQKILSDENSNIILSPEFKQPIRITSSAIIINPYELQPADRETLRIFLLRKVFDEEGMPVVQQDALELVREIDRSESPNRAIMEKLRVHIPAADMAALRISLLVRDRSKRRKPIDGLLEHLHVRYGRRGHTINNLCGRGYLEREILPYLKNCKNAKQFEEYFEEMIQTSGHAVFVHSQLANIENEICEAADRNWSYGKRFVKIYGIGHENVSRIEKAVSNLTDVDSAAFKRKSKTGPKKGKIMVELDYLR